MVEPRAMCMGWKGKACEDCARLARDAQDEKAERWVAREDIKGKICPMFIKRMAM